MSEAALRSTRKPSILKIGIATAGRRDTLTQSLVQLGHQRRLPDEVIICPASPDDCDERALAGLPYPTRVVRGTRGSSGQRNTILDHCNPCDLMLFLDDDFYASHDYLERLERIFSQEPAIVGLTGKVLVDGAISAGVEHDEARAILAAYPRAPADDHRLEDIYNLYGCNMAVRMVPVRSHRLRFDENLPLYGWLEDVDFTRRLAPYGRIARSLALTGVHLAIKRGRSSGVRTGYSQVANPWYLMRKGTMAPKRALRQVYRNVGANVLRAWSPEPWVDRRGRLRGNAIATVDFLRGRLDPRNVVALG